MKFPALIAGIVLASVTPVFADVQETVDIAAVKFPDSWERTARERTYVMHAHTDAAKGTFCQLYAYVSTTGTGAIAPDFEAEWANAATNFNLKAAKSIKARAIKGWAAQAGKGTLTHNNRTVTVSVHVYSAGTKRLAYIVVTNDPKRYAKPIATFLGSVTLPDPSGAGSVPPAPAPPPPPAAAAGAKTTTFSDGWTATEERDWVRGVNGAVTVLVHHRMPDLRSFNNVDEATSSVWTTIVVPRYSGITNLWVRRSFWSDGDQFNGKYFAEADAKGADGKAVHVALYRSGTGGRWVEIVTPTKATFISKLTTVQKEDGTNWTPLTNLTNLNKFPVAASDLPGTWASSSGASVDYVNVYTGNSAGTAYASSTNEITFRADGTYDGVNKGAMNTQNGQGTVFHGLKTKGQVTVKPWELTLTGREKGATHTFTAQFEAVAGGRILHLWRGSIEEMHLFKAK